MNCASMQPLFSAWIDQELSQEQRQQVDEHLAACPSCKAMMAELQQIDQRLRNELSTPTAQIEQLVQRAISSSKPGVITYRTRPWRTIALAVTSAAAGFLLAVALVPELFNKQQANKVGATLPQQNNDLPIQLALAIGIVEIEENGVWKPLATGTKIQAGQRIRTPSRSRCELRCNDGSEVRMNSNSELTVHSPRQFHLTRGQVWSTVAKETVPFQIKTEQGTVTALGTQFDLDFQIERTTLTVLEGKTQLDMRGKTTEVKAGQQLRVDPRQGNFDLRQPDYQLYQATNWVNEILVLKGRDNPELIRRINDVMASIGETKMLYMAEEEMRTLGDHCVVPLCRYLQSDRSKKQEERRHIAARIIADLAQPRSIGDLIELLSDADPQVRGSIARGLARLTRQDMGVSIQQWQSTDKESTERRDKAMERWKEWWKRNQEKYPETGTNI